MDGGIHCIPIVKTNQIHLILIEVDISSSEGYDSPADHKVDRRSQFPVTCICIIIQIVVYLMTNSFIISGYHWLRIKAFSYISFTLCLSDRGLMTVRERLRDSSSITKSLVIRKRKAIRNSSGVSINMCCEW